MVIIGVEEHFWLTTSGMVTRLPLTMVIRAIGINYVMFAVDYPYNSIDDGRQLLEQTELIPPDLEKLSHQNAGRLLG